MMSATNRHARSDDFAEWSTDPSGLVAGSKRGESFTALTAHAQRRLERRNVAPNAVDYAVLYGRVLQRTGITFYFLGWRDVPPADRCASWASRLEGTTVLMAANGVVITAYRNQHAFHTIQCKMKRRIPTDIESRRHVKFAAAEHDLSSW